MKYFILLCKAVHLFLLGWIVDFFIRRLDCWLERKMDKKKPLSKKTITAYGRLCESLFVKWQKCEKNYLLFRCGLRGVHNDNNL